jgi:putative acetyltransferase
MIRELQKADINKVADIWLDTNVVTHYFISKVTFNKMGYRHH